MFLKQTSRIYRLKEKNKDTVLFCFSGILNFKYNEEKLFMFSMDNLKLTNQGKWVGEDLYEYIDDIHIHNELEIFLMGKVCEENITKYKIDRYVKRLTQLK